MVGTRYYSQEIVNELLLLSQSVLVAIRYLRMGFFKARFILGAGSIIYQEIGESRSQIMAGLPMR